MSGLAFRRLTKSTPLRIASGSSLVVRGSPIPRPATHREVAGTLAVWRRMRKRTTSSHHSRDSRSARMSTGSDRSSRRTNKVESARSCSIACSTCGRRSGGTGNWYVIVRMRALPWPASSDLHLRHHQAGRRLRVEPCFDFARIRRAGQFQFHHFSPACDADGQRGWKHQS